MVTVSWKVYGRGERGLKESYNESYVYDFTRGDDVRIIEVDNFDKTGTHEYSVVRITRNTKELCKKEMCGQISDGIFENQKTGKVERIG